VEADAPRRLTLDEFQPRSMLVTEEHSVPKPRFAVIDAHNHAWDESPAARFVETMDRCGVRQTVILDAPLGEEFSRFMDDWVGPFTDRFLPYTNLEWRQVNDAGWPERMAAAVADTAQRGARGLKVPKSLGLRIRDAQERLYAIDDPRFDPMWAQCGAEGIPVCIHTGDPAAFFEPLNETNERWEELHAHPHWHFHGGDYPGLRELLEQLWRAVKKHPGTTWYGAHVGNYAENLGYVAQMLDDCPNYHVDISERIPELGRQPRAARRFFLQYQDRILFGTDRPATEGHVWPTWYRLLETEDEYFAYSPDPIPRQGRWRVYGLGLPDEVLAKVYHANAERLIPGARLS